MRGFVIVVSDETAGSELATGASAAATTLEVVEPGEFNWEAGGQLTIGSETHDYTVDAETELLHLGAGLASGYSQGEPVLLEPVTVEREAEVQPDEQSETLRARVPHVRALHDDLDVGIRDDTTGYEVVEIDFDSDGELVVKDLLGIEPAEVVGTPGPEGPEGPPGPSVGSEVQIFTADGTWTKPAGNFTVADVKIMGGGGGGGSGERGAPGTARFGGQGGSGGNYCEGVVSLSELDATEFVAVGNGGSGGSSRTSNNQKGQDGNYGGSSSFGDVLHATGGMFGGGGGSGTFATLGKLGTYVGRDGGGNGAPNPGDGNGGVTPSGRGGGGGGGISNSNVNANGGQGGGDGPGNLDIPLGGNTTGEAGDPGDDAAIQSCLPGGGGGGGAAGNSAGGIPGGIGGLGGLYGSGGGGGGASGNGGASGAGGEGADGIVIVICR